jgi:hypothetical protein
VHGASPPREPDWPRDVARTRRRGRLRYGGSRPKNFVLRFALGFLIIPP